MYADLRCRLSPGQFSTECAVIVRSGSRELSLFADKFLLDYVEDPTPDHTVDGWLRVTVLSKDGARTDVLLPQTTLEAGTQIVVSSSDLRPHQRRQG